MVEGYIPAPFFQDPISDNPKTFLWLCNKLRCLIHYKDRERQTLRVDCCKAVKPFRRKIGRRENLDTIIKVENLRKVYRLGTEKVIALANINLDIHKGEICCILGTSGSGKSTLLNMLAGLEKPTRGHVYLGKHDIAQMNEKQLAKLRQRHIGFIFQSYNLLPALTALENVGMPLLFRGVSKHKRNKQAGEMLRRVGLEKRMKHRPTQMSGGQQQRVGIARAFVCKPEIVFADEPTGNLDSKTTKEVMNIMVEICRQYQMTLVLVTHDQEIASYADRIITLIDGEVVSDVKNHSILDSVQPISEFHEALYQQEQEENAVAEVVGQDQTLPQESAKDPVAPSPEELPEEEVQALETQQTKQTTGGVLQ